MLIPYLDNSMENTTIFEISVKPKCVQTMKTYIKNKSINV